MNDKIEALEEKRGQLTLTIGQKKYLEEVIKAELLQHCQELMNLNNEINKAKQYLTPAPKFVDPTPVGSTSDATEASASV